MLSPSFCFLLILFIIYVFAVGGKVLRDKHHIAVEPLPSKGVAGKGDSFGKVDTFGLPELRGAWSGGTNVQKYSM
jgi:hypothetical protein